MKSLLIAFALIALPATGRAADIDFNRDVRPILSDKCFACHGRDAEHREGGLRLDERAAALKGGDSGEPAIVSEQPEKSELVRRVFSTDDAERMIDDLR